MIYVEKPHDVKTHYTIHGKVIGFWKKASKRNII